jgi:hypothetical protein
MPSIINNIDPKSATGTQTSVKSHTSFALLSRGLAKNDMRIINYDERKKQCYFDVAILDRKFRIFGHHRGEDVFNSIRVSIKDTIFGSLKFAIMNGPLFVPNCSESLLGIPMLGETLVVTFDSSVSNTAVLSWSVLFERACMTADMQVQAGVEETAEFTNTAGGKAFLTMLKLISKQLAALNMPDSQYWIDMFNNVVIAYRSFKRCVTLMDYIDEIQKFYRIFLGRSAINDYSSFLQNALDEIIKEQTVQADSTEVLQNLREAFDMVTGIGENATVKKLQSLFSYALVQGYLKHFNMELSDEDYSKMEQRQLMNAFSSKRGFFFAVLDTSLHIAERLNAWYITGDFDNFLHSEKLYVEWLKEADRLLNLAAFTSNLTALGDDSFKFKADLETALVKGRAYAKFTGKSAGTECVAIRKKLCSLELLNNIEITKRAAQIERKAPFGVIIAGHSSIAKSAFTKVIYNAYGSLFDLDRTDAGCYSRNSFDEFWSGFNSSQWCIRMDDIAFMNPAKATQIDNSIIEMLNIINNVPFVPNQASLEAKGTTPVLAKLVIATTNTLDLNTSEYFSCPLAANRRLPYVVVLKPKKEYLHENQIFIDPAKLACEDGKFPDFWEICVKEIVPEIRLDKKEYAKFKEIAVFDCIDDFIQHFLKAAKVHEANQTRAVEKNSDMAKIEVCKVCLKPLPHTGCMEVQAGELTFIETQSVVVLLWLFSFKWIVENVVYHLSRYAVVRYPVYAAINRLPANNSVRLYARLVELRHNDRVKKLVAGLAIVSGAFVMYYATQGSAIKATVPIPTPTTSRKAKLKGKETIITTLEVEEIITVPDEPLGVQATGRLVETQLEKETKCNVWYKADPKISTFDMPIASMSLATATNHEIRDILDKNCVAVCVRAGGHKMTLRGIFIVGQKLLLPAHAFKFMTTECEVNVIDSNISSSHHSNCLFTLTKSQLVIMKDMDLCMIEVTGLPPRKSVLKYFLKEEICPTKGFELMRQEDGTLDIIPFFNLRKECGMPVESLGMVTDIYMGTSANETAAGMCGSVCIGTTPRGPVIMGIHLLGRGTHVGFLCVKRAHVESMMAHKNFRRADVQGLGTPILTCSKRSYAIQSLHHRSLFRYLPAVNANLYGTLDGFAGKPKSKVCATPMQSEILTHYNREVAHGAPALGGYEGVKQNVAPMVVRTSTYNKLYLKDCVDGFSNDLITRLSAKSKSELIPLSTHAAINGLPGVQYIDGINRATSMGFPFNTTKKEFLEELKSEEYPDGVTFTKEIMDDIERIKASYAKGLRVYPVFAGHGKDEAVPLAKVLSKKIRLFTGSPIAWSVVVRENLLTFVRCVQKNKLIFEAAPGLVCQSNEWDLLRDHLVQHGEDQIVAGDYGKFDKRMIPDFILAAFDVIINVLRDAGWTEDELLVIQGIAYDVAFPVCNISGDLVEFFGTNPSGHPLTVIINSLVNSLYIRYAYRALNPAKIVSDFIRFVALITYGDDNSMGISKLLAWFNHTTIQECLASIGVEYTMADKTSESIPYINISETSFLKRTWRWDEDMQCHLCPLEEDSIFKSLTMWVPSDTIDKYSQFVFVVGSAVQEYFFYGKEKFEEKRGFFMNLLKEEPFSLYVTKSTFPTYDQLAERFRLASVSTMEVQGLDEPDTFSERVPRVCWFFETKCSPDFQAHFMRTFYMALLIQVALYFAFHFYCLAYVWFERKNKYTFFQCLVQVFVDSYFYTLLIPFITQCIFYLSSGYVFAIIFVWCRLSLRHYRF